MAVGPMLAAMGLAAADVCGVAVDTVRCRAHLNAVCRHTVHRRLAGPGTRFYVRSTSTLAVPRVLGWDRRRGVLTQSRAPGVPLRPCLSTAGRQRTLAMAARALAALHGSGVPLGPATGMRDHVADLIHPDPDQMARAVPDLASRLAALTRGLRHWTPAAPSPVVPIHRDCHPRQMLLEGDRVWLVDWDLAARGDAALDVANFAVYLQTHLATRAEAAAAAFLDAYAAHRPLSAAHVAACTAFTRLRLAVKQWRLRRPDWRRRAARLLDDAERALS